VAGQVTKGMMIASTDGKKWAKTSGEWRGDEKGCMSSEEVKSVTENRRELPICSRINITVQCLLFLTKN